MGVRAADVRLFRAWTVARLRILRRLPRASFFTFVFPLILFVLIGGVNTGEIKIATDPVIKIDAAQYYAPSIGIFSLLTACYTSVIFAMANAKEQGILKRVRGTPLPPPIYVAAVMTSAVIAGMAAVTLMFTVAVAFFGVHIYADLLPGAIVTLVLGGFALAAMGMFVSTFVKRADSAPAVANITMFPILFLSGIFFPTVGFPDWLNKLVDIFPVSHIVHAFESCFSPFTTGAGFDGSDLAVIAAWFVGASILAARRFRFESESD
jgi:ABC-2 type transport system permease protein